MTTKINMITKMKILLGVLIAICGISLSFYASSTIPQVPTQASSSQRSSSLSKVSPIKSSLAASLSSASSKTSSTRRDITEELLAPQSLANQEASARAASQATMIAQAQKEAQAKIIKLRPVIVDPPIEVATIKSVAPAPAPTNVPDTISIAAKAQWEKDWVSFTKPSAFVPSKSGISVKANLTTGKLEVYNNGVLDKAFDFSQGCNMTYANCVGDQAKDKEWLQTPNLYCVNGFSASDFKFQVPDGRKARTSKYVESLVCQKTDGTWQGTDIMLHTNDWGGAKTGGCIMPVAGQGYSFVEYLFNKNFVISFVN